MLIRIPRCDALGQNPRMLRVAQVASIAVSFGGPEGSVIEIGWLFQSLSFGPGDALHRPYSSAHTMRHYSRARATRPHATKRLLLPAWLPSWLSEQLPQASQTRLPWRCRM